MIIETIIDNGLIKRKSDRGVYIRNEQLGHEYTSAIDLPNEKRKKLGLEEYSYVETERVIEEAHMPLTEIDLEIYQKAKAFDILIGGAV